MQHGKIVCIGQNYRAHAKEMDSVPPKEPMLFLKPSSAIIGDGEVIEAGAVGRVDHEVELALIIGRTARRVAEEDALSYISHLSVFNDVTARDLQSEARRAGNPWTLSKGMDTFAPMSRPVPTSRVRDVHDLDLELKVNGEVRQRGNTKDLIFGPERLVAYISSFMTLEPGDIIATGTPEGVSPLNDRDRVEASIPGVGTVRNTFRRL
ncbi:MAG: fumarylacetoacetate hydrolase family protein [Methanomassiliicoccus sp.]|nr:fumarylacetoacetate hydrolase family protein [Methanomassiliicoccus sp.]